MFRRDSLRTNIKFSDLLIHIGNAEISTILPTNSNINLDLNQQVYYLK